ncbi:MAG: zinc-dependent metalloprotease [Bacteroidota bacterium]|nr:zinc-dependent metalloprotease [Bacteroidota bacterium]
MKTIFTFITLFLLFFTSSSYSQSIECGTETPLDIGLRMQEYHQNKMNLNRSSSTMLFPIKAHIIRTSAGGGGLTDAQLYAAIDIMNDYYINSNMQFYLCDGINYIHDSNFYNFDKADESTLASLHEVSGLINIYFANSVTSNGSALCGYAYYPGGPDRILMANSCAVNGSTLSHEMGHFFYLVHTHGGSNTNLTSELVNGSNCSSAGDYLCDTQADPMLSNSNVSTQCNYTGTTVDANGDLFVPNPTNIMSYSRKTCRTLFTQDQYDRIEYTATFDRNYFACSTVNVVTSTVNTQLCVENAFSVNYQVSNNLNPGNEFTAELSNSFGNFSNPSVIGSLQSTTSGTISAIIPASVSSGSGYRIRIVSSDPPVTGSDNGSNITVIDEAPVVFLSNFPFSCVDDNSYNLTGGTPSGGTYSGNGVSNGVFDPNTAGTGLHTISYTVTNACSTVTASKTLNVDVCSGIASYSNLSKIEIIPNPAKENVTIKLNTLDIKGVSIEIISIHGELLFSDYIHQIGQVDYKKEINLTGFSKGVYFVKFTNMETQTTKKLLIN